MGLLYNVINKVPGYAAALRRRKVKNVYPVKAVQALYPDQHASKRIPVRLWQRGFTH
jgi:hypothetical protein